MARIAVTGGRHYANEAFTFAVLDAAKERLSLTVLIHGGASGLDRIAARWAARRNVKTEVFPANWKAWGNAAGPKRNQQMVDSSPDVLIAFPGGRGTDHMKSRARYAGLRVIEVPGQKIAS